MKDLNPRPLWYEFAHITTTVTAMIILWHRFTTKTALCTHKDNIPHGHFRIVPFLSICPGFDTTRSYEALRRSSIDSHLNEFPSSCTTFCEWREVSFYECPTIVWLKTYCQLSNVSIHAQFLYNMSKIRLNFLLTNSYVRNPMYVMPITRFCTLLIARHW